jgi:hypothetical protein
MASVTFLAEVRGTPAIGVYLAPAFPTGDFAVPMQPRFSYGRFLNRLSHRAVDLILLNMFRPWWNAVRSGFPGLKPFSRFHDIHTINGKPVPHLFAVSEALVPRPRDWPSSLCRGSCTLVLPAAETSGPAPAGTAMPSAAIGGSAL